MRANFENARSAEQFATGIVKYNRIAIKILGNTSFIFVSSNHSNILCTFEASNGGLLRSQYSLNYYNLTITAGRLVKIIIFILEEFWSFICTKL